MYLYVMYKSVVIKVENFRYIDRYIADILDIGTKLHKIGIDNHLREKSGKSAIYRPYIGHNQSVTNILVDISGVRNTHEWVFFVSNYCRFYWRYIGDIFDISSIYRRLVCGAEIHPA